MKIRNGFVSNSSSSSFVVLFPRIPQNYIDVKNMLFDEHQKMYCGYDEDNSYSVEQVSNTVWNDICDQNENDFEKAKQILANSHDYDAPNYKDFKVNGIIDWDLYNAAMDKYGSEKLKEFFNIRKLKLKKLNNEDVDGGVLYCFNYADEDGSYGSALEHGGLFEKLKHISVSNH